MQQLLYVEEYHVQHPPISGCLGFKKKHHQPTNQPTNLPTNLPSNLQNISTVSCTIFIATAVWVPTSGKPAGIMPSCMVNIVSSCQDSGKHTFSASLAPPQGFPYENSSPHGIDK